MKTPMGVLVAVLAGAVFLANTVIFTVNEWEQVVVTEFGQPKRVIKDPGLHFKSPLEKTRVFEDWLLDYDSTPEPIYTKDKKILVLDNYARWRIADPLLFLQALRTEGEGLSRLDDIIFSEMRKELGLHTLSEIVSENREDLMALVTERSDEAARSYGIEVVDVRIKRADLPPENEAAVFDRMRAERNREAMQYRSEGEEQALTIRAETDLQAAQILAEAEEEAQRIRGAGAVAIAALVAALAGAERLDVTKTGGSPVAKRCGDRSLDWFELGHGSDRQAGGFGEAKPDVERLHRLATCSFHEVVLGTENPQTLGSRIGGPADFDRVCSGDIFRVGQPFAASDTDEWLVGIALGQTVGDGGCPLIEIVRLAKRGREVKRGEDAAIHRDEVRGKLHGHRRAVGQAEFLFDLREVPVLGHAVRPQALVALDVQEGQGGVAARTADAAERVGDDLPGIDQPCFQQRDEREQNAGRVTAG